ncbi:MAG TPA: PEGA domain-containing protein [Polyangia bacterium]|nr:PEGA domain-containing protein [Polyangia bacterium]
MHSRTVGAEIYVDGRLMGKVPMARPISLAVGQHTVKITKRGFTDYLDVVTVREHKRTPVDVDLLPVSGIMRLSSSILGARVFVDGKFVGEVSDEPVVAELAAGKRSVRVVKGGYHDFLTSVEAVAGQTIDVRANLTELPASENPFRPPPPPPPKWYDHWYVWATGAAVVVALTAALVIPAALGGPSSCRDFPGAICFEKVP